MLFFLVLAVAPQDPTLHWKLDGSTEPAKAVGRIDFIDSPILGSGRLLVLNGVDAALELDSTQAPSVKGGDFSVSVWIFPLEMRASGLISRASGTKGWSLEFRADGSVAFESEAGSISTPARTAFAGQWVHVVASIDRSDTAVLYVNGEAAVSGKVGPMNLDADVPLAVGRRGGDAKLFCGLLDEARIYARALSAEEVATLTDQGLPWLRRKSHPEKAFPGRFELLKDDVVVFTGGENAYAAQLQPFLEARLHVDNPERRIFCRTLAWEGDTVFEQWRVLNFAPWDRQFARVGATVLFCQFGQMESLKGKEALPAFAEAYGKLLDEFSKRTKRIVLFSPFAFQKTLPPVPDLTARNDDVRAYAEAIRTLAEKRGLLFVDLFGPTSKGLEGLTRDGVHLTADGHSEIAGMTAQALGLAGGPPPARLLTLLRDKNAIWIDHWRPTNWAFLNGDRMEQPSSRDHKDRRVRWFPVEVQKAQALIRAEERKVEELLRK